jgi:lipid-binding SYLF domain-containing protein
MKFSYVALSVLTAGIPLFAADTAQERLKDSTDVLTEVMATPDKGIPHDLLDKANCIVIVPGVKQGAFIVGAKYGKGFVSCRHNRAGWGAPGGVIVEGGSFGFQIGANSTDVVMLIMNERGMRRLLEDKFTIGADAAVAAGPVGRSTSAETDAQLSADILSWSRSKGLFAGVALTGATLRNDKDSNRELYGEALSNKEVLMSNRRAPAAAQPLIAALDKYSPHESKPEPLETRAKDKITGTGSADRSTSSDQSTKPKK